MADKETMPEHEEQIKEEAAAQAEMADAEEPELLEEDGGAVEPSTLDEMKAKLEEALQKAEQQKDLVLRSQAELQNVRRRAERDVEHAHKFGMEKITQELLPVVDNLERALEAAGEDNDFVKALREGVELTLSMFLKALAKFQIEPVNPEGEPFDPSLHQAVSMVEQSQVEPNTVVSVMQKGYTLHGRIVRPAMVVVAKGASQEASNSAPKDAPKIDEQA